VATLGYSGHVVSNLQYVKVTFSLELVSCCVVWLCCSYFFLILFVTLFFRDDIVFKDPLNTFKGLENYKRIFWALRFTGRIFFKALWVDIVSIWQPAENLIMIRWIAHGIPRVPWDGHGRFDGASVYKLDKNGKIYEHKVHNVAMNPPTKFKVLPVHELIRSLGCPSTAKPTYFEASSQYLCAAPSYLRLAWIKCYISLCRMLSLANLGEG